MPKSLERLDKLIVERGLAETRAKAQAIIMEGVVFVNGKRLTKAGSMVNPRSHIEIRSNPFIYVSRGGLKLAYALEKYPVPVEGKICMDVGASTGGWTDCLLKKGASKVYAVDVGYGQLDWKLRNDKRVVVLEKHNIRYLPKELVPDPIELATIDTSFISLRLVIPAVMPFLAEEAWMVALIKPQFEAGREKVGKGGVVKDEATHIEVCDIISNFVKELGFSIVGLTESPIRGQKGNKEFIIVCKK